MSDFLEPKEERFTTWKNPLEVEQYVDITHDGDKRPTRYRFKPGQVREIQSRYDHAIHHVHNGVVIGGLAPRLVKVGSEEIIDPVFDPDTLSKKEAEADQAAAVAAKRAAEHTLIASQNKLAEIDARKGEAETPKKK